MLTGLCAVDSARNLAAARIVVFASALVGLLQAAGLARIAAAMPPEMLWPPDPWMPRLLRIVPRSPGLVEAGIWVFAGLCVMGMVGVAGRWCAVAACAISVYLFGIGWCLGNTGHEVHHVPQLLAVLAVSPCTDAWSLFRRRGAPALPQRGVQYGVPLRIMWVLIGLMYFFPGFWKFQAAGFGWVTGDHLRWALWDRWTWMDPPFRIDRWPLVLPLTGFATCVFEVAFIAMVFWRPARLWLALFGILFHTGVLLFMQIHFESLSVALLMLLNWDALAGGMRAGAASGGLARPLPLSCAGAMLLAAGLACGGAIACGMVYYGVRHDTRAWPVGCYPTFAWVTGPVRRSAHLYAVNSEDVETPLSDAAPRSVFGRHWMKFNGTMLYIIDAYPRERVRREAFIAWWVGLERVPPGTVSLRLREVMTSTDPDALPRTERTARLLAELPWPAPARP